MSKAPSAILAINSLDRFINVETAVINSFYAHFTAGSTILNYDGANSNPADGIPTVGAELLDSTVFSPGTRIVSLVNVIPGVTPVPPAVSQIIISNPTIAPRTIPEQIFQTYQDNTALTPTTNFLPANYNNLQPYSYNFTLQSQSCFIYGYIRHIIISQIQMQYNIPTINLGLNDVFYIQDYAQAHMPQKFTIPYGFYYPDELAAALQTIIRTNQYFPTMTVVYSSRNGFKFTCIDRAFYFPDPGLLNNYLAPFNAQVSKLEITNYYKTLRLLGMTISNSQSDNQGLPFPPKTVQQSSEFPNFLYTSYIDIFSDSLTNYQSVKDTNTSIQNPKGLLARVYLSGTGQNQTTGPLAALGTAPFIMTADLNSPKIIKWNPDVTITSIDIQMRDQYGDFIPGADYGFSTEFQMTLLCAEGR
jgi:hypothetical protein